MIVYLVRLNTHVSSVIATFHLHLLNYLQICKSALTLIILNQIIMRLIMAIV